MSGEMFSNVTLSMISWKAHETVAHTIESYRAAGILDLFGARRVHFNEVCPQDRAIAQAHNFEMTGSDDNLGIFGAVAAVVANTTTPYVLSLENDCPLVTDKAGFVAMMRSALADMEAADVPVFLMRSRREPGEKFIRRERYDKRFRVAWPIGSPLEARGAPTHPVRALYEDLRRSSLRGSAIYAEEDPAARHPRIIQKTPRGNWVTRSPYLTWSNNAILVRTAFFRDVILEHVRRHPAKVTVNGTQDIEAAMKEGRWWKKQNIAIGQSEPGPFTHKRLDR